MTVAIKIFKDTHHDTKQTFEKEVEILSQLNHPNVIRLVATQSNETQLVMILELAKTSLDKYWPPPTPSSRSEQWLDLRMKAICLDVAHGLHYLHTSKVVHLDLKPPNILLKGEEEPLKVCLSDFGISRTAFSVHKVSNFKGTWNYGAPETITQSKRTTISTEETRKKNEKVDIFGFGMVVYFLLAHEDPWFGEEPQFIWSELLNQRRPELRTNWSPWATGLMKRCWAHEPKERPSSKELLEDLEWTCKKHDIQEHTVFISYRVAFDSALARQLADTINSNKPFTAYLDKDCLNHGEDWTHGFMNGLRTSKSEILLISKNSMEQVINKAQFGTDNVLKEWEESLQ
eukprot:TRINITY_DN2572_c0_g2_i6.p1 TRINITY_DN2572_c0_g2~~TRINITY_DN2572_c0_g2_i6.p1  ORF type:complete len:392 (-),score=78.13 TRINITY_DN2572_c0_g2_i6:319-1353(-)